MVPRCFTPHNFCNGLQINCDVGKRTSIFVIADVHYRLWVAASVGACWKLAPAPSKNHSHNPVAPSLRATRPRWSSSGPSIACQRSAVAGDFRATRMSFFLTCPNCGPRDVSEFRFGGQILPVTAGDRVGNQAGFGTNSSNLPGPQRERWYHRFGCRRWIVAERDVRTNEVLFTGWLDGNAP
jgi:heterotetrameric sarcosine oxidase delta subunit